jgi:hypothetical protein
MYNPLLTTPDAGGDYNIPGLTKQLSGFRVRVAAARWVNARCLGPRVKCLVSIQSSSGGKLFTCRGANLKGGYYKRKQIRMFRPG